MGAMSIEKSETSVEESSPGLPVAEYVAISWTPDAVLCVWCFNRNIISLRYFWRCTRSSLTSELHMELIFYSCPISDLWETFGSLSKCLGFMVSESQKFLHLVVLTLNF